MNLCEEDQDGRPIAKVKMEDGILIQDDDDTYYQQIAVIMLNRPFCLRFAIRALCGR